MPNKHFFFSTEALVITVTTASTSALSSLLVMAIILRSQSGLSTTYHIIMFFMSFWDFISSAASALVTLPMPSDVHAIYPFSGYAVGTSSTCAAQGFSIVAGQAFSTSSIVALNFYYIIAVRYGVSDNILKKRMLPILLAVAIIIVFLPLAVFPLYLDLCNPRPYEPYCLVGQYPEQCTLKGIECIGGDISTETFLIWWWATIIGIGTGFFLVFVSLVLVIMLIFKSERAIKKNAREKVEDEPLDHISINSTPSIDRHLEEGYGRTRRALRVSLLYIGAFFLTWIWTILTMALGGKIIYGYKVFDIVVDTGKLVFNPLQGFFNALIFIYDKVCMVKSSNQILTFTEALKIVLFFPEEVPEVVLTSIDIVTQDLYIREMYERDVEIEQDIIKNPESSEIASSIPSDFKSVRTPSFALSDVLSSQGVDKEHEERIYNYMNRPRFYRDLPSDLVKLYKVDISGPSHPSRTATLSKTIKNSSSVVPNTIGDTEKCKESTGQNSVGTNAVDAAAVTAATGHQTAIAEIEERSHFTSNSFLSGFSSILTPISRRGSFPKSAYSSHREKNNKRVDFVDDDLSINCSVNS
jgi:hypothetical protein